MTTKASAKAKKPVCSSVQSTEQSKGNRITARVTTVPSLTPLSKQDQLAHSLSGVLMSPYAPTVQRKCSCGGSCDNCKKGGDDNDQETVQRMEVLEEEKEEPVQGKFGQSSAPTEVLDRPVGNSRSGMPARLKTGLESLSGLDLSPVRVHYNDPRPAKINAYAYTRGLDIHVAPGQERHLPHEGWHTVQQMQGRVSPTTQAKGVAINDSATLEREADVMGERAMRAPAGPAVHEAVYNDKRAPVQRSAWDLFGGKCCNNVLGLEWALVDGVWKSLETGECTGSWDDCDGMTCGGGFYHVDNFTTGSCVTPREDDEHFTPRRWTPGDQKGNARSPEDEGSSEGNLPPGYEYDAPKETDKKSDKDGEKKTQAVNPFEVGGDTKSAKVIRIAWTFDDGPTTQTPAMKKTIGLTKSTWFVMFNQIKGKSKTEEAANLAELNAVQKRGGEIGIHSYHETKSHVAWFPMSTKSSYSNVAVSMSDFGKFHTYLTKAGLNTKFVRLPFGLISELVRWLRDKGHSEISADTDARKIIAGTYSGTDKGALEVKAGFDMMIKKVGSLGLHLWGGKGGTKPEVSALSWEAESSGVAKRADNITKHVSAARKADPDSAKDNPGKFERLTDLVVKDGKSRSLIVLAHDTTSADVKEVGVDKSKMESYATSKAVKIEYYTLSGLYEALRGTKP